MKHPSVYSDALISIFNELIPADSHVLDPMAGIGKIAQIKSLGWHGQIACNELEPEWLETSAYLGKIDMTTSGDARCMPYESCWFDVIVTSPTYGNRMADHFNPKDKSRRITYKQYLGRDLTPGNTGRMQFGHVYCDTHLAIYYECHRVLRNGGLFILNVSDHIRNGRVIHVAEWHKQAMEMCGFEYKFEIRVATPRMRFGRNREKRVDHELVVVFRKGAKQDGREQTIEVGAGAIRDQRVTAPRKRKRAGISWLERRSVQEAES